MWSKWNRDYLDADFPRLLIRMEDTIFYPKQVLSIIANCTGMELRHPFQYTTDKGKAESKTTLVTAMVKYGSEAGRIHPNLTRAEREYLRTAFDPELMRLLHYRPIRQAEIDDAGASDS